MSNRFFNAVVVGIVVLMVAGVMAVNLIIDPFSVFGTSSMNDGPSSNERYRKIEHLIDNQGKYTHLIFGSSRSGMTDPALVDALTGDVTYNLSVFSGTPADMQKLYRAYRSINGPPRAVTIGLDAMAFLSEPDRSDLSRRHHLTVDPAGPLSYWLDYLLAPSLIPVLDKLAANEEPNIEFNWANGTYALTAKERSIEADHAQYIEDTFSGWVPRNFTAELDNGEWVALKAWLSELERDQVVITVFLQPMHHQWQKRMAPLMPDLGELLEEIPGLVDLSELGANDDRLWYEQRHYRPVLARQVISDLYGRTQARAVSVGSN